MATVTDARKQSWLQLTESFRSDDGLDSGIHTKSNVIRYLKYSDAYHFHNGVISLCKSDTEHIGFIRHNVNGRPI